MDLVKEAFDALTSAERVEKPYTTLVEDPTMPQLTFKLIESQVIGSLGKGLIRTPLRYKPSEGFVVCTAGTGSDFGFKFDHEFTNEQILTIVVVEDAEVWTYKSSMKNDDGDFVTREVVLSSTDLMNLINSVYSELQTDVSYYHNKRLTFK